MKLFLTSSNGSFYIENNVDLQYLTTVQCSSYIIDPEQDHNYFLCSIEKAHEKNYMLYFKAVLRRHSIFKYMQVLYYLP